MATDWRDAIDLRMAECLAILDQQPKPETELDVERRVRVLGGFARAAATLRKLADAVRPDRDPEEEDEDEGMAISKDRATLERKHRELDEGLDRLDREAAAGRPVGDPDSRRAGGRVEELAAARQRCSA